HVTQRGNTRQQTFFNDDDYLAYLELIHHGRLISIRLYPIRRIESCPGGLVAKPEAWPWSSAEAHIKGKNDLLVKMRPLCEMINKNWKQFLAVDAQEWEIELSRKHERTGRPLGKDSFVEKVELLLNRRLRPRKPGSQKR
ncbi:MAG: hypothetical protein PF482_11460, partial [Desulfobacteraceae bacterium]|nr:hypothetical protein [Desulfobacteraceae bacterium]